MLIAQITDTHITRPGVLACGRVDSAAMLAACVACVRQLNPAPELVLLTGDLADSGDAAEYARLRELLAPLPQPLLAIPGNHDAREPFRAAFGDQDWMPEEGFLHFTRDLHPPQGRLRVVGLDTLVPGDDGGELCAARLAWLKQSLESAPDTPTLIAMHHPPFLTGLHEMDGIGLRGRDAFADIVAQHAQVQLICCGHLHRTISGMAGGRRATTCPSSAHQLALDLGSGAPARFRMEPPGFMLHLWTGTQIVSHVAVVGDYPGPFDF